MSISKRAVKSIGGAQKIINGDQRTKKVIKTMCPKCHHNKLWSTENWLKCTKCGERYDKQS